MRQDSYRSIASHYDLHLMDWYAGTYGKRLQTMLTERGLAGSRLLDAGCGTGTLALMLAGAGYRVTGIDLSESLLRQARRKDSAGAVRWIQGDITRLALGETFDVVVSVADVLNHLDRLEAWGAALRGFAEHLRPGGYAFFDVMTCHGLELLDVYSTQDRADRTLILGIIWEPAERRSTLKITSFVPAEQHPGLWERASDAITEWGYPVEQIFACVRQAGFDEPQRLWPVADDPERDERLAVLAQRH